MVTINYMQTVLGRGFFDNIKRKQIYWVQFVCHMLVLNAYHILNIFIIITKLLNIISFSISITSVFSKLIQIECIVISLLWINSVKVLIHYWNSLKEYRKCLCHVYKWERFCPGIFRYLCRPLAWIEHFYLYGLIREPSQW